MILTKGDAWTPQRFWPYKEESDPKIIAALKKDGWVESIQNQQKENEP